MCAWSTGFGPLQKSLPVPLGLRRCCLFMLRCAVRAAVNLAPLKGPYLLFMLYAVRTDVPNSRSTKLVQSM